MTRIWTSPFGLLVVTGTLLGLSLPLGKAATAAGVPAIVWSLVISGGAGLSLLVAILARGERLGLGVRLLRYYFMAAAISYAAPNILMFSVIPHLGAGFTGIMFTLSPVVTLLLATTLKVRRPKALGMVGILLGFAGALTVAVTRGEAGQPAALAWVGLGLLIPVCLALGNIYRTLDWPEGVGPLQLAAGSHLAAAAMLLAGLVVVQGAASLGTLAAVPWLALMQAAAAATMFVFFFRLQTVGGPVYLSQIGYVAAAIGLLFGTLVFGERYQFLTWVGAAIIAAGVALTTRAQED